MFIAFIISMCPDWKFACFVYFLCALYPRDECILLFKEFACWIRMLYLNITQWEESSRQSQKLFSSTRCPRYQRRQHNSMSIPQWLNNNINCLRSVPLSSVQISNALHEMRGAPLLTTTRHVALYTKINNHVNYVFRRNASAHHFYQNRQLELYAAKETKRLTLRQLVRCFVQFVSAVVCILTSSCYVDLLWTVYEWRKAREGVSVFLLWSKIVFELDRQSANYVRSELTVRIAHRLRDMQALPFIVVTQEEVAKVYEVRQSVSSLHDYLWLTCAIAILGCLWQVCFP